MSQDAAQIQRDYYARTAVRYDDMHLHHKGEHQLALNFLVGTAAYFDIQSVLDIGSGTGRGLSQIKSALPHVTAVGVEPSLDLRRIGYSKGLPETDLIDGDARQLAFPDGSFDMVCEFGVLHHIPDPARAISEMLRVSRKAIFISDNNNFGQGSGSGRRFKQALDALGLWQAAYRLKTRGKGYTMSDGDGLAYSFSVFSHYKQIASQCKSVHMLNTQHGSPDLYRSTSHVALLGLKHD